MPDVVCPNCGASSFRYPSQAHKRFCDKECFNYYRHSRYFGEKYGRYTIIGYDANSKKYLAECTCGISKTVKLGDLRNGSTKSCGCYRSDRVSRPIKSGTKFGRLTVLEEAGRLYRCLAYSCQCSCGEEVVVAAKSLRRGHTKSCGCLRRDATRKTQARYITKHGLYKDPAYLRHQTRLRRERDADWTFDMDKALRNLQPVCVVCGSGDRLSIDHVIPFIKGGKLEPGNVCVLCMSCNSSKQARNLNELPSTWQIKIRKAAQEFYDIYG